MPSRIRTAVALLACAHLFLASPAAESPAEVDLSFREGLLWLKVESPLAARSLNFLLDTGSAVTVISADAARELGLRPGRKVPVQGVHSRTTGYIQSNLRLTCGGIVLPAECVQIDLTRLSSVCSCSIDGLIGADFLDNKIVQIDFAKGKLRLLASAPNEKPALALKRTAGGILIPVAVGESKEKWTRLDTGCAAALHWVERDAPRTDSSRSVAVGLTDVALEETRASLRLGDTRFDNVAVGLHRSTIFPGEAGLVGTGLLSRFKSVTISTADHSIWFSQSPSL